MMASEAAGIPRSHDYNGPEQDGVAMFQVNQRDGRRWSAADAFLRPALKRPNLEVMTRTRVLRVEFEGDRAVGVRIASGRGRERSIRVEREVILSAGSIQSPQLLLLSGIGTESELSAVRKVLNAAAWTYVAAFVTSLVYFLFHLLPLLTGRRE